MGSFETIMRSFETIVRFFDFFYNNVSYHIVTEAYLTCLAFIELKCVVTLAELLTLMDSYVPSYCAADNKNFIKDCLKKKHQEKIILKYNFILNRWKMR